MPKSAKSEKSEQRGKKSKAGKVATDKVKQGKRADGVKAGKPNKASKPDKSGIPDKATKAAELAKPTEQAGVLAATLRRAEGADAAPPKDKRGRGKNDQSPRGRATGVEAIRELLTVREGFDLSALDPDSTPGFDGDKDDALELTEAIGPELGDLQERLYAESKQGGGRSVLLIIQGMDTSGKGGVMRHVVGLMDPQGVGITAFKAPTREERSHPFLWRIRNALPKPGELKVFDRSQYEDVLIVRVRNLVPPSTWSRRYAQINAFEASTASRGTTIVKVMLHISKEEQGARLLERLDRPDKHWKYNPGDVEERKLWDDYMAAYQAVFDKTTTDTAPWYVVPANQKWYAHLAVARILLDTLRELNPQWPPATFDVEAERKHLAES